MKRVVAAPSLVESRDFYGIDPAKFGHMSQRQIETACWWYDRPLGEGGRGGLNHFKRAYKHYWSNPEDQPIVWNYNTIRNDWLETQIESLVSRQYEIRDGNTRSRFISWTGCGTSNKTTTSALFGTMFWLAKPSETTVILTSTSKSSIRRRVWPVIQRLYDSMCLSDIQRKDRGNLVDSKTMWQLKKGDDKHGIFAVAVEQGELQAALDRIKGIHSPYMMLIIDEANTTPEAIFECVANYRKGCKYFILLVIANAVRRQDNHGKMCEPKAGWGSVTVDSEQWETRGVPKWGVGPGWCFHFDGTKSPNVRRGQTIFPFIYTWENFREARDHGDLNSINYWSQDRGFWTPEGVANTVLTEPMIYQHHADDRQEPYTFFGEVIDIASLDPAFGGNACMYVHGRMGRLADGRMAIQILNHEEIKPSAIILEEKDHQIAKTFIEFCKRDGVSARRCGTDATGIGRGVYSHLVHEWSPDVYAVEFGGCASDRPASSVDPRCGKDVYTNQVTELWWSVRDAVVGEQIRGIYPEAISEFCAREYTMVSRRYKVIPKEDCAALYGRSPDNADSISVLVEVARRLGLSLGGAPQPFSGKTWWDSAAELGDIEAEPTYNGRTEPQSESIYESVEAI